MKALLRERTKTRKLCGLERRKEGSYGRSRRRRKNMIKIYCMVFFLIPEMDVAQAVTEAMMLAKQIMLLITEGFSCCTYNIS